ncbi:uncharacterized protein [Fopius arisanus]|uniref:CYP71C3 protein n=1 Tax=Fopius arisanus TaxID=64838 RepID=A0A0C9QI48_9HYME|nr:PREDICTED: uncharacterized protein LOC105274173 isoform X1 [Fopius arisanus]
MTVKLFLAIFAVILTGCGVSPRPINGPINEPIKISLDKPEEFLDNNIIRTASGWERSMDLLGQIVDALRIGRGRLVNFAMMTRNIIAEKAEEFTSEASNKVIAVIAAREAKKIIEDVEAKKSFGVSKKKGSIQGEKLELKTSGNDEPQKTVKRSTIESHSGSPVKTSPISDFFPPKTRENARLENEGGQSLFELPKKTSIQKLLLSMFTPTPLLDRTTEEEKYGNSGERFNDVGRALVNGFEALSNFINTVVDLPVNAAKKTSRGLTAALNQVGGKLIGLE